MKRLATLALCLCLFLCCGMTAFAEETVSTAPAVISTTVPSDHTLMVIAPDDVTVSLDGKSGNNFSVERLSEPTLEIKAPDGKEIVKVTLNGENITDKLVNGQYKLPPVYEDLVLVVETKSLPEPSEPESSEPESSKPESSEPEQSTIQPSTSSTPESNIRPADDKPATGDTTMVSVIAAVFIISLGTLAVLLTKRKEKDD